MRENPNEMLNLAGNSFGEIIREYRIKKGMTQGELGALVRVKKNAVGAWEAGRSRPDLASVPILCNTLGIPIHVFFGMDAPETFSPFQRRFSQLNSKHQQIILREMDILFGLQEDARKRTSRKIIRLYQNDLSAAAGPVSYLGDEGGRMVFLYADEATETADEIIRVSGDSMEPTFFDGDQVLVHHQTSLKEGEIGIFIDGSSGYIKEYRKDGLYSHNPKYRPMRFSEQDSVKCFGKVLGKVLPEQIAPVEEVDPIRHFAALRMR